MDSINGCREAGSHERIEIIEYHETLHTSTLIDAYLKMLQCAPKSASMQLVRLNVSRRRPTFNIISGGFFVTVVGKVSRVDGDRLGRG